MLSEGSMHFPQRNHKSPSSGMHRLWLGGQQLPQHVLQNATVGVVLRLLRRINADQRAEFRGPAVSR